jgi:integral membrane protein (TIGR01906 family)
VIASLGGRAVPFLLGLSTAVVIVAAAIAPFLAPPWIAFAQERADAAAWSGYSATDLREATDSIVSDLVLGAGDFDVSVGGAVVLTERERDHMRDVRDLFRALWVLAAVALVVLIVARRTTARTTLWRAVGRGSRLLAIGVVVLGAVASVAFDVLFETFHRLFFADGTYLFDPTSERLVQLFPLRFWQETTIAVGAVIVVLAVLVAIVARRRTTTSDEGSR